MILKSRNVQGRAGRFFRLIRPQKAHHRTLKYWAKRFLRIRATPHALALGAAIGIFAAFSPALGVHFLLALALAFLFGGNLISAGLATAAANPLTFPLMIAGDYEVGKILLGRSGHTLTLHDVMAKLSGFQFGGMWEGVFKPLFAGSFVLGALFAFAIYGLVYFSARAFEASRAEKRHRRQVLLP